MINKATLLFKKPKKVRKNDEAKTQIAFFEWLFYKHPKLRKACFAIPNGGSRHKLEAYNLRRQGVTSGVPDVFCAIPNELGHGLFIEFKAKKRKMSDNQENMFDILKWMGYNCITCWNTNEAIEAFEKHCKDICL